jgi:DNA adenine methylase
VGEGMRSPITYFGGKGLLVKKLLQFIPKHQTYVEVFGGACWLLFAKSPSPVEVYNDINGDIVNLFRVIRDPEKFKEFHRQVSLIPYSREEFNYYYNLNPQNDIERAVKTFIVFRQSIGGIGDCGWGYSVERSRRKMAGTVSMYLSIIDELPLIHQRLFRVQIENDDFRKVIPRYDYEDAFFYCDPPYIPEMRRQGKYEYEMTLEDHKDLIELLLSIKGSAMLSCYYHSIYEPLIKAGWQRKDFQVVCSAVVRARNSGLQGEGAVLEKQPRTETILIKYNEKHKSYTLFDFK